MGPVTIAIGLAALACSIFAAPAGAADVATAPDGTVTLVAGLQYTRISPDGSHTPYLDYAPRESEEEGGPTVAVAADGTATVVWVRVGPVGGTAILARRIAPDGTLEGGIAEIGHSEDPHVFPKVVVAPDGTATAVWTASKTKEDRLATVVEASRIAPDGTAQATPTELAVETSYQPDVAVAPDGTATVAWQQFGDDRATAMARRIAPDGSLGEALQLSSGVGSAQAPVVAGTPDGAAVVVWEDIYWNGVGVDPDEVLEERRIAPNGKPEKGVNTISSEPDARAPIVAAGPDGTVTVLWSHDFGSLLERRIEPDGTPEETLHQVSASGEGGVYPELEIADDGSATVVWSTGWRLLRSRLDSDGIPEGPPQELLASNGYTSLIGMGFDPDAGTALPIWSRRLGYYETEWIQQAMRLLPDGTAGPIFNLTEPGTEPATWANPESVDYGSAAVGETVVRSVEFTNRSVDSTPVSGVSLRGSDADQFEIVDAGSCTDKPLPFVGSCAVTVAFTPSAPGPMKAELALEASAPREPRLVALAGMALPPQAEGDPPGPELSLADVELDKRRGTARISLAVTAAGDLEAVAGCPASRKAGKRPARLLSRHVEAGEVEVLVRTRGVCRQTLDANGSVKLRIAGRFAPDEGQPSQTVRSLVLRKRAGG